MFNFAAMPCSNPLKHRRLNASFTNRFCFFTPPWKTIFAVSITDGTSARYFPISRMSKTPKHPLAFPLDAFALIFRSSQHIQPEGIYSARTAFANNLFSQDKAFSSALSSLVLSSSSNGRHTQAGMFRKITQS